MPVVARIKPQDDAVAAFREALRLKPDDAISRAELGLCLCNQDKLDESAHRGVELYVSNCLVCHGEEQHAHGLRYDHLVIAVGSVASFLNLPGVQQHALTMKSISDAMMTASRTVNPTADAAARRSASNARSKLCTIWPTRISAVALRGSR